jgi:hypothetical protein
MRIFYFYKFQCHINKPQCLRVLTVATNMIGALNCHEQELVTRIAFGIMLIIASAQDHQDVWTHKEDKQFEIPQIRELEFPNTARPTNGVRVS